ncbi:MAG: NAD/NADP octopine/nopaline dehydrogenase family protein [Salinivirgaceae bacterium]|nr:NAD/NADP octopine/nopaline dehydrogenase family protein [Salinivirgaceae bacterium]
MVITICGGGHLGHVCAGVLASREDITIRMFTRKPHLWSTDIEVNDPNGKQYKGKLNEITADPAKAICGADVVLICLPGYSIAEELQKIRPYLEKNTIVGTIVSSTGFFFRAFELLPSTQPLFGFQRVPFISRITEYGHSADLLGYKASLAIAVEQTNKKEEIRALIESLFKCPVGLLESHYEVSLTNSNPLLHTSRLYSMFNDYKEGYAYENVPQFYSDWTVDSSELLIAMDGEFQHLLDKLGVREGAIPTILNYYESKDADSLTKKIRSIKAFQGIASPMKESDCGYVPDFDSRYFTEDFPFGLKIIHDLSHEKELFCPNIDKVYEWGMRMLKKQ